MTEDQAYDAFKAANRNYHDAFFRGEPESVLSELDETRSNAKRLLGEIRDREFGAGERAAERAAVAQLNLLLLDDA